MLKRFTVEYRCDLPPDQEFEEIIKGAMQKLGYGSTGSGYHFPMKMRDLSFELGYKPEDYE